MTLKIYYFKHGEEAYDADSDCIRQSKITTEILSYDRPKAEDYLWIYPLESLAESKMQSTTKDVFLLGAVDNVEAVIAESDEYIWMVVPIELLNERLDKRTKQFGKSLSERKLILSAYHKMSAAHKSGIFTLDATKPVEKIADDLLNHTKLADR